MLNEIIVSLLVGTLVLFIITREAVERLSHNHYEQKSDFYAHHVASPKDIVFYGDSITDGANWHELFPGLPVKGRGINNDSTTGVLNRIQNTLNGHPHAIFILIGTNDLPLMEYRSDPKILATYEEILQKCKELSPETNVFVQSILPRKKNFAARIQGLNVELEKLAEKYDYTYIDLFSHFATPEGQMRDDLTNDHLHLMSAGYDIWVEILTPYIQALMK